MSNDPELRNKLTLCLENQLTILAVLDMIMASNPTYPPLIDRLREDIARQGKITNQELEKEYIRIKAG
jgi:hypothetical protein